MYDFAYGSKAHFEVFLDDFMEPLLHKWKENGATHSLTVVFFSRLFLEVQPVRIAGQAESQSRVNPGRRAEDACG